MAPLELDELVREFLIETHENLDQLDHQLLALEQDPAAKEAIGGIFRTVHTVKGTCGFLGFGKLEALAHVGESLLSRMRDGELTGTREIMDALLALGDAIRQMLAAIETTGREGEGEYGALTERLVRLHSGRTHPGLPRSPPPPPAPARGGRPASPTGAAPEPLERGHSVADGYVRVDVGLLDDLMNLVGELVLARNQILQLVPERENPSLTSACQRLNLITTELQSGVMKTRMQAIGNVWDKFPRLVRDLAASLEKQVVIEMQGKETELDKTIIEAIKDPLTHLVRNCVDHGIEMPEDREIAEKPPTGTLRLYAYHEGGQVNIEISDDGAGLDVDRIRSKALERAIITPEQAARMTDRDLANLIFLPGFSTAHTVSSISGRGVGMDVVRTNIEKIGGVVDLSSRPGFGTTFRIKIPLTLAIIPALIVSAGGERYAIPQVSLLELLRLEPDEARGGLELLHDLPFYRLRGTLLPIVHLDRALEAPRRAGTVEDNGINVVVLQAGHRRFGLVVDEINDTEEIVVKPLGAHLKGISAFAGATIMGDGHVALILDVPGLGKRAKVISETHRRAAPALPSLTEELVQNRQTLLLFQTGDGRRMAMPLSAVDRLEEFPRKLLERFGDRTVVQYRGDILPLIDVGQALGGPPCSGERKAGQAVVVFNNDARPVGLAVERILDIVDQAVTLRDDTPVGGHGVLGCIVLGEQVTELLDVAALLAHAAPELQRRELRP